MSKTWFKIQKWAEINCWPLLFWLRLFFCGEPFRRIPLSKYKFTSVSPEDYDRLCKFRWCLMNNSTVSYAYRNVRVGKSKKYKRVYMHNEVLHVPENMFVDHDNHNGLNNRRSNLRQATETQNMYNRRKLKTNATSRFKGVFWQKDVKFWRADITINGKTIFLGLFTSQVQAARAYDAAAKKYQGQFAVLNFPRENYTNLPDLPNSG
jgi:hypothetical protein